MQGSIQRLRWVLIAGALLLIVTLTAYIGYGRYRALKTYSQLLRHSGISITRETDGFTYSQSVQGKTIFTIHAAKAVQHGEGQWTLHDVVMTFYGREPGVTDHILASEVEYDEKQGVARAQGEVHMDLQAPQALTGNHTEPDKHDDSALIHVRTSGLVYLRKLGVAATDQPVEFRYGGVQCTARGAEFNTSQSTLRLLAEVHMTGAAHGQPVDVTATRADMDRTANVVNLTLPVATSLGRSARADAATLLLRKDGSIDRAQAGGNVVLRSDTPHAGTRQATAARLDATLSQQTVPETARLSGGVVVTDSNPLRPMHGSAAQVDAIFNPQGAPASITATGGAKVAMTEERGSGQRSTGSGPQQGLARELEAAKIVALFAPAAKGSPKTSGQLRQLTASGMARASGESPATSPKGVATGGLKSTLVAGDELQVSFAASAGARCRPQTLHGSGHTLLQQDAPLGEQQTSTGDTLEMAFVANPAAKAAATPATVQDEFAISSAVQAGHVSIHDRAAAKPGTNTPPAVSTGSAARAVYDGAMQKLTLTGDAHLSGDNASLTAPTVVMDRAGNVAEAFGGVRATLENAPAAGAAPTKPSSATHVLSASARFEHESKVAVFRGTDAQPARLWQDASQVQAAELTFDGQHHTFSARPAAAGALVHAVFTGSPANPAKPMKKPEGRPAAPGLVRVAAPKMDYNDVQREAVFSGGVRMDGTLGEVRSQRALIYLTPVPPAGGKKPAAQATSQPNPMSGSLERVVVVGSVQMEQPGRRGTGEQLVYTAASDNFVLTGTPEHRPMVVDTQQGSVTGTSLTFGAAGSTIVVAGEPGSATAKHARVRTETEVRQ